MARAPRIPLTDLPQAAGLSRSARIPVVQKDAEGVMKTYTVATNQMLLMSTPMGIALPWFPHLQPALPSSFVECNGQTLSDPDSPFDGKVIPNLNAAKFLIGGEVANSGQAVGSNSVTLDQTNLPVVTLNGTAAAVSAGTPSGSISIGNAGSHNHAITDPGHSHGIKGSATGLLTGITGYAVNSSGLGTGNSNSATTGISLQSASDHTHTAAFTGSPLSGHSHPVSVALNAGQQTTIDNRPAAIVCRWVMRVK